MNKKDNNDKKEEREEKSRALPTCSGFRSCPPKESNTVSW